MGPAAYPQRAAKLTEIGSEGRGVQGSTGSEAKAADDDGEESQETTLKCTPAQRTPAPRPGADGRLLCCGSVGHTPPTVTDTLGSFSVSVSSQPRQTPKVTPLPKGNPDHEGHERGSDELLSDVRSFRWVGVTCVSVWRWHEQRQQPSKPAGGSVTSLCGSSNSPFGHSAAT